MMTWKTKVTRIVVFTTLLGILPPSSFSAAETIPEETASPGTAESALARPALEKAMKFGLNRKLSLIQDTLLAPNRQWRDLEYGFSLLYSLPRYNREGRRLLAKAVLSNKTHSFGERTKWVLQSLAREAMRGCSNCVAAWGFMHSTGIDMPADPEKAYSWYRWSALVGNKAGAEFAFEALLLGVGVQKDAKEAFKMSRRLEPTRRAKLYYNTAAKLADAGQSKDIELSRSLLKLAIDTDRQSAIKPAIRLLGSIYGPEPDPKAMAIVMEAGRSGEPLAQKAYARLLWKQGTPEDVSQAIKIFTALAQQDAQDVVSYIIKSLDPSIASPEQIQGLIPMLTKLAQEGNLEAAKALSNAYFYGLGVAKSPEKSLEYLRIAAEQNDPESQYRLALIYARAEGIERDTETARDLLMKSERGGYVLAGAALMALQN